MYVQTFSRLNFFFAFCLMVASCAVCSQTNFTPAQVQALAKQVGEQKSVSCTLATQYMMNEYRITTTRPSPDGFVDSLRDEVPKYRDHIKLFAIAHVANATYDHLASTFKNGKKPAELQTEFNKKTVDEALDIYNPCLIEIQQNPTLKVFFNAKFALLIPRVQGTIR